jgi:hypothetical protein
MSDLIDTVWLAGLLDGEGCFHFARSTRPHTKRFINAWIFVGMTHEETVERAGEIMRKLSGDPCRVQPKGVAKRRSKKAQWRVGTTSKMGTLRLAKALIPYLVTKRVESLLMIRYLERAVKSGKHQSSNYDFALADMSQLIKKSGCRETYVAALALLDADGDMVILNEAAEGKGSAERAETRSVSPNDNPIHERPALSAVSRDDDIVRTPSKDGRDLNSRN